MTGRSKMNQRLHDMVLDGMVLEVNVSLKKTKVMCTTNS
jgi:hypothetical protein